MNHDEPAPWAELLERLRNEYPELYRSWFDDLEPGVIQGGELRVRAPDPARADYLRNQCGRAFVSCLAAHTGYLLPVRFYTADEPEVLASQHDFAELRTPLNADYRFDQFVVGPSNRLAHAACQAVCNQPGTLYNPLFIHGASGLGKTHLLQAVCEAVGRAPRRLKTLYVSCETFVNEFVNAIEYGRLPEFREAAREVDVLAIDDVQFLQNRESSQEELFHTFNVLYQTRRQIILSADSRPAEIPTLEDRLMSRFNWGLVTQIDPPNRETRHAILQKKTRLRGAEVPDDVLDYIAQRVDDNIRVLEGALTKLVSEAQIGGQKLNLDLARHVLDELQGAEPPPLQVSDILSLTAAHYGVRVSDLIGRKRSRSVTGPRQVAMYITRKLTPLSLEEIGLHFGGRDHSTVLHAERCIEASRQHDARVSEAVTHLTRQLLSRR